MRKAPSRLGQMVGKVTSQKQRAGRRAEDHGGIVHLPVVAHELRQDDQEGEGHAFDRIGGDGREDVAGQAENARIEGERGNADEKLGHEERRQEDDDEQGAPLRGKRRMPMTPAVAMQCRKDAAAEADDQAVEQRVGIKRIAEQIGIGLRA